MIKTRALYKKFNQPWVIDDLNLTVQRGEFYCLLGPNGAGKTTTLKLLSGLIHPTRGRIYIGGFDIARDYHRAKQLLGFIPDVPFLYENLTAVELLEFVGTVFDIKTGDLTRRMEYYFELFGLSGYRHQLLRDFSHGMRQRIVYIANLLHDPHVLLVDEPLVGLDPQGIHLIKKLLTERVKNGMTVLMSTHILQIAEELADRIGIISRGRLIQEGTLNELKTQGQQETLEDIFLTLTRTEDT